MSTIILERAYTDAATIGRMILPSGRILQTIELPWRGNQPRISCIPEGLYKLTSRQSSVVNKTSRGRYKSGWEVVAVEGRSYIMIHIANTVGDIEGCIGVGLELGVVNNEWAVIRSAEAFDLFMREMDDYADCSLLIKTRTIK